MAKAGTAYVEVIGDFSKLRRQLATEMAHVSGGKIKIDTEVNDRALKTLNRDLETSGRNLRDHNRNARAAAGGTNSLTKAMKGLHIPFVSFNTRIPVARLAALGKVAYDAAGGVISLTSAIAPMTGVLGAIGPLATAAAQGIGSIKLATAGVGDVVSAAFAEQDKAATSSAASLSAQASAAEQVREAQLSLTNAQRTAKGAQEDLTRARFEATREIEDMKAAVRDLALEEEGASLSLKEAKAAFAELSQSGAGELEIERAALRIKEARAELRKTREEGRRAQQDLGAVSAGGGVKGMPQVVAARRSLQDANRGVVEAEREVANAIRDSSKAMNASGGSADALAAKMAALSPPARQFAKFLIGLRPELKKLQGIAAAGLLPGVEKGITAAMHNLPILQQIIGRTSKAFGDLAEQAGRRLGSDAWGKDLEVQGARNETTIRRLGQAGLNLAEAFRHVTLAAGPMVDRLTKWVVTLTHNWQESARLGRETGRLQKFFKDAGDTFFKVERILKNLALAMFNIGKASRAAFGNDLLDNIAKGAKNLQEWTKSAQGQKELRSVFRDIGDDLKRVGGFIRDISDDFRRMKREGQSSSDALSHIFINVFAKLVEHGAEFGAKMAVGFVKGFIHADIWGKLVAGVFLTSRLAPLIGLFRTQGRVAGAAMGEGMAEGATAGMVGSGAAGAAGGGLLGRLGAKLLPLARRAGIVGLGVALADTTLGEFSRRAALKSGDAFAALRAQASGLTVLGKDFAGKDSLLAKLGLDSVVLTDSQKAARKLEPALKAIVKSGNAISGDKARELREQIALLPGVSEKARKALLGIVDKSVKRGTNIWTRIFDLSNLDDQVGRSTKQAVDIATKNLAEIGSAMGFESKRGKEAVKANFEALSAAIRDNMKEGRISVQQGFRAVRDFAITNSRAVAGSAEKNFGKARDFIRDAMRDGLISTRRGMKLLRDLWFTEMAFYGFSKKDALNIRRARSDKPGGPNVDFSPRGTPHHSQRGGPIDMGAPVGDTVPALLERGEYVLNRKAVKQVGRETLDRVNFRKAPRFQEGGVVGLQRGGHPSTAAITNTFDGHPSNVSAAIKKLIETMKQRFPLQVTSTTDHSTLTSTGNRSDHVDGHAVDLASGDYGLMNKAAAWVKSSGLYRQISQGIHNPNLAIAGGKIQQPPGQYAGITWAQHANHIHLAITGALNAAGLGGVKARKMLGVDVSGPGGGVQALAQGSLDLARKGAQKLVNSAAAEAGAVGADLDTDVRLHGSGPVEKTFAKVAKKLSKSKVATLALGEAGYAESGMQDLGYGDASSQGALQLLASTAQGLGVSPHDESAIASLFFTRGFYGRGGANTLAAQGLPAYLVAQGVQGSHDSSGSNYAAQESRARAWMKRYGLAKGGLVGMVGDSLGVGTQGPLKGRLHGRLRADNKVSRRSPVGLGILKSKFLGKDFEKYVFDLGTNDDSAGMLAGSVKGADKATGKRPLVIPTLNGPDAAAKNKKLRGLAGGNIHLVEWAKRSKDVNLDPAGIHADPAGYAKRAAMISGVLAQAHAGGDKKGKGATGKLPKLKGSLTHSARQTAAQLSKTKNKKRRAKILNRFKKYLKKYGLPTKLLNEISFLGAAHERYATLAESAALLNVDNDDDTVTLGSIAGDNVAGWLTKDLGAMFSMRNKLVKARDIVTRNEKKVAATIRFVNAQIEGLSKKGHTPRHWKGLNPAKDSVEKWNKQAQPKRIKRMKEWHTKHGKLPGTREFNTHNGRIKETSKSRLPALKTTRGQLVNLDTELTGAIAPGASDGPSILPQLEGLQGPGPQGLLKSPWPIGTIFGGDILTTQLAIAELFKVPPKTTDDTTADKADDTRVPLLEQLLREANLRTAVSERQFDVLRNFPPFGGQFATGGVVPGPAGAPRTVIAHGGETITPVGAGSPAPNVYVSIDGKVAWLRDFVDTRVEAQTRSQARRGGRVLPGQAGGR